MGKRALIWKFLQDVRASYWFLPSVLVVFGLVLAGGTEWVDRNVDILPFTLPEILTNTQAEGARSLLAVIAQSIIGVTGVMFSMTLVAVSFASGNFGPRLIGNFMRDRGNQLSLGILISTFVYSLVVLRTVQSGIDGGAEQFVPHYSLIMAMLLTLLCVFTLIYFVHHVPETINVSRISSGLGKKLERQMRDLVDGETPDDPTSATVDWPTKDANATITSPVSGYIQTCNTSRLQALASDNEWHIEMRPAVGHFVTTTTAVFRVWSQGVLSDDDRADLRACFAVGYARTENQNPAFLAEQLVEMAARALSPGVNDPYTAMDCLNRLTAALAVASNDQGGLSPRQTARLRTPKLDFAAFFAVTFPLCRQYIRADDITRAYTLDLLKTLQSTVRRQDEPLVAAEIDALTKSD